jgi:tetratricopeptide (TPR) repeat protein
LAIGNWQLAVGNKAIGKKEKEELSTANDAFLLNEVAGMINALGDHRKAIAYYEQALSIWKKVYGENHPNVAICLNNLGSTYLQQGQKEKAKAYLEQAYKIKLKFYGPEHPSSKTTAEWLEKLNDE